MDLFLGPPYRISQPDHMPTKRRPSRARVAKPVKPIPPQPPLRSKLADEARRQIDWYFAGNRGVAANVVDDAATQVSRLMTGHAEEFSAERLLTWLERMGSEITIAIRRAPARGQRGKIRVRIE